MKVYGPDGKPLVGEPDEDIRDERPDDDRDEEGDALGDLIGQMMGDDA